MTFKQAIYILIAVFLICLVALYLTWEMTKKVEIEKASVLSPWTEVKGAADVLNLEITPYEEPTSIYKEWKYLRDSLDEKLREKLGLKVNFRVARDYRSAINDAGLGAADLVILPATAYIEARKDYCVYPLVTPLWSEESPGNRCVLIARKDSGINSIADIKGRSFAYSDEKSLCGSLIVHKWMRENNIVYQGDLKAVKYFPNYDAVIEAINSGGYDVGGVKESVFQKANLPDMKVIATSEPVPDFVLVSVFDMEKSVKDQVIQAMKETDPAALKQINPHYTGWQDVSDGNYESLRTLVKEIHGLDYALPTPDFCLIKPKCKLAAKK